MFAYLPKKGLEKKTIFPIILCWLVASPRRSKYLQLYEDFQQK